MMGPHLATLISSVALGAAGYLFWATHDAPPVVVEDRVVPAAKLELKAPFAEAGKPVYSAAVEQKPLFSRSRRPYVESAEPEPEPEPEPVIAKPVVEEPTEPEVIELPPEPKLEVLLRGIIITASREIAVVYDPVTHQELSLHEGEAIRDWILERIERRKVIFRNDELIREITLPRAADEED